MKNHDILFDKKNSMIGFVKSNCDALKEDSKSLYRSYAPTNFIQNNTETGIKSNSANSNHITVH